MIDITLISLLIFIVVVVLAALWYLGWVLDTVGSMYDDDGEY